MKSTKLLNRHDVINHLRQNAAIIRLLVQDVANEAARWRPDADSWSILEVINHLYDEEREDFRVRLDLILHRPDQSWPPIDPPGWVTERQYNARSLSESLGDFLRERQRSLTWLEALQELDWATSVQAPWGKAIRAGDMLAAWTAHDLLHMRQLVALKWAMTRLDLAPYRVDYAGDW